MINTYKKNKPSLGYRLIHGESNDKIFIKIILLYDKYIQKKQTVTWIPTGSFMGKASRSSRYWTGIVSFVPRAQSLIST